MKTVLLMGDSIRLRCQEYVQEELAEEFKVIGVDDNCGDTRNWLQCMDEWLEDAGAVDIIHFNAGLHDIKRMPGTDGCGVAVAEYQENLVRIVERLCETGAELIWAMTTPVIFERHHAVKGFDRLEEDVEDYNAVAASVMEQFGIRVNDLHSMVMANCVEDLVCEDGVHFTREGSEMIADTIAVALRGLEPPVFSAIL